MQFLFVIIECICDENNNLFLMTIMLLFRKNEIDYIYKFNRSVCIKINILDGKNIQICVSF